MSLRNSGRRAKRGIGWAAVTRTALAAAAWTGVLAAAAATGGCAAPAVARGEEFGVAALRLDQIQVIGSHNSYKKAPQPELLDALRPFYPAIDAIDYAHPTLTDQLNLGLRNLEFDLFHDPTGGRYADPLGNRLLRALGHEPWPLDPRGGLRTPGFKVLHDADFDFRSHAFTLEETLAELRAWSEANPGHTPVIVTFNAKQGRRRLPEGIPPALRGATADVADFDAPALAALSDTILNGLGRDRLLTPADVRGRSATLREAVTTRGWPTVRAAAGRFVWILDEGYATTERFLQNDPDLDRTPIFPRMDEDHRHAAVFVINDPVADGERIRGLVRQGFLVRTRADADTREPRANDLSRFAAAKASGAQVITTDYYLPDRKLSDRFVVRFDSSATTWPPVPAFARPNPVTAPTAAIRIP